MGRIFTTPACGLHDPVTATTYHFRDLADGARIGRNYKAEIPLDEASISWHHATLRRAPADCLPPRISPRLRRVAMTIEDASSQNGTMVDGLSVEEPVLITVFMRIRIGGKWLHSVDWAGRILIVATTQSEFRQVARDDYGSNTLAAERIGCGVETIRRARNKTPTPRSNQNPG